MKDETQTFYQELMKVMTHPSDVIVNPNEHYTNLTNLRLLYFNMDTKLKAALEKGLTEDKEIEAKKSVLTIAVTIRYVNEMYLKLEQLEKEITNQQIVNLNLLISNKEKEAKITDLMNRI